MQTKAIDIVTESANRDAPFFLYLALPHVHWPVEAEFDFTDKYFWEKHSEQRNHYGMLSHMDAMIGSLVKTLKETDQYENTIIVVMGDNGGYSVKWSWLPFDGTGSNYPLTGAKGNNQEGGTRVPSFVHSPLIKRRARGFVN